MTKEHERLDIDPRFFQKPMREESRNQMEDICNAPLKPSQLILTPELWEVAKGLTVEEWMIDEEPLVCVLNEKLGPLAQF